MAGISVRIRRNQFGAMAKELPITVEVIINGKRGPQMVEIAKARSRVDTGEMRDGWEWIRTGQGSGMLQNLVPHTEFNELGTIDMAAAPMARPAAEEVFPLIVQDITDALARAA